MKKRIIFLDVDGVLNGFKFQCKDFAVNWSCVRILKEIIEETWAEVVISSSWRLSEESLSQLYRECLCFDLDLEKYVIWKTPKLTQWRWAEIRQWLLKNPFSDFVILEDSPHDMIFYVEEGLVVKTDHEFGLTAEDKEKAIKILTQKEL